MRIGESVVRDADAVSNAVETRAELAASSSAAMQAFLQRKKAEGNRSRTRPPTLTGTFGMVGWNYS
jgi:hypothetical protein